MLECLVFSIDKESFALPLETVEEVIRKPETTRVPRAPHSLKGIANLRGAVLPVVSLRRIFSLEDIEDELNRVVVCSYGHHKVGFLVDRVYSVINAQLDLNEEEDIKAFLRREFIKGIVKDKNLGTIILLDIEKLLEEYGSIVERDKQLIDSSSVVENVQDTQKREQLRELVVFQLAREQYGVDIDKVKEILNLEGLEIIKVPGAKDYVLGVVNYRGGVLPIISLKRYFNLKEEEGTRVVVISKNDMLLGLVVDSVREVLGVAESEVEPISKVLSSSGGSYISEVCRVNRGERIIFLFNPDVLFGEKEVKEMAERKEAQVQSDLSREEEVQIVVFKVGKEEYAVDINRVQEIVRVPEEITKVPKAPEFVEGVMNLRGNVLPIVSMRKLFGLEERERNDRQRILVLRIENLNIGFLVDTVLEVLKVSQRYLQPPPKLSTVHDKLFTGVINLEAQGRIIQTINCDALLNREEVLILRSEYGEENPSS